MFSQVRSRSGREIRPTTKMHEFLEDTGRLVMRQTANETVRSEHRRSLAETPGTRALTTPEFRPARWDTDTLLRMQQEIEDEIRATEINISRTEEGIKQSRRRSRDAQSNGSSITEGTSSSQESRTSPRLASTPGMTCIVLDHTGPDTGVSTRRQMGRTELDVDSHGNLNDEPLDLRAPAARDRAIRLTAESQFARDRDIRPMAESQFARDRDIRPMAESQFARDRDIRPMAESQFARDRDIRPVAESQSARDRATRPLTVDVQTGGFQEDPSLHVLDRLANMLSNKQDRLPRMEPEVFSGNLLDFPTWINSFEALIEQRTELATERLFFLGRYTSGDARSCIQGYLTLRHEDAYVQAKSLLIHRFGDKVKIGRAYKKKLDDWPVIKAHEGERLQKLSDFLWQCQAAMATISHLRSLEGEEENQKIVRKLPYHVAQRWSRIVDRCLYGGGQNPYDYANLPEGYYPSFSDFCKFVSDEARIACGPCNARPQQEVKRSSQTSKQRQAGTLSTQASWIPDRSAEQQDKKATLKCTFCRGTHVISKCDEFLNKDPETKKLFARNNGLCFGCLRRNHLFRNCRSKNPSLMEDSLSGKKATDKKQEDKKPGKILGENQEGGKGNNDTASATVQKVTTGSQDLSTSGALNSMILPVIVGHANSQEEVMTYALLDNMSDTCFIKEELIKKLNASSIPTKLEVTTLVAKKIITSEIVTGLTIRGVNENTTLRMPKTYGREEIEMERSLIPRPETVGSWPHLQEVADQLFPYHDNVEIGLLIGANCSAALLPRRVVAGEDHQPYALKTAIGWGVIGWVQNPKDDSERSSTPFVHRTSTREVSPTEIGRMFQMDFMEDPSDVRMSVEDKQFLDIVETGILQDNDGHFQLPLPLKKDAKLPQNRDIALKRLKQLKGKMMRDQKFKDDYVVFMSDMLQRGYAEPVPSEEVGDTNSPSLVWYIPHHGVYHPKKPEKIRVVFDCSAEYKGEALNKWLLQGPDLINNLTGILCRFREEEIVITCDIEAMFHQVNVRPDDRDLLRFMWWEDGDLNKTPKEFRMTVHLFGATSSPACANYALKATADKYEEKFGSDAANFVRQNFYVDDGLQSVKTPQEAIHLVQQSHELCKAGGFNLHKFASNNRTVVEQIPEELRAKNMRELDLKYDALPIERTLGVEWCIESDSFQFRVKLNDKAATRRGILSSISSIYDPLGLIAPILLEGKRILQAICKEGKGWDEPVSEALEPQWGRWKQDLEKLSALHIPRCHQPKHFGEATTVQLHHFSDASQRGYGQCSYVRLIDRDNQVATSLVMAKSRVAPTKAVTIPRLELTAAVTSVKVGQFLNRELTYKDIENFYWTDSKVVLGYISNEAKRFHIFVANRVQQIHDHTEAKQWHYISTKDNPADLASRGTMVTELIENPVWWKGPQFLSSNDPLPLMPEAQSISAEDPEVKKTTTHSTSTRSPDYADLPMRLEYFSSWHHARKAVALCRQYLMKLKERCAGRLATSKGPQTITVEEVNEAEKVILRSVQQRDLPQCYTILKKMKGYPAERSQAKQRRSTMTRNDSNLFRLDPYLGSDHLIRVGGRLRRGNIPRELAHPIIVPEGHIARLLIGHFHQRTSHSGRGTTLNEIRASGYWILRGRPLVSSILNRCVTCRKLRHPPATQKMADLPEDRLEPAPPFTHVGVDYFGPFYVKEGRSQRKRWGCLFTCLVTRAAHIEVASSLSTDSFLNAYRRLVGRRGPVRTMRSDRGTNFVGAKAELEAALSEMNHVKIQRELLCQNCDWVEFNMNLPHASHMGGVWERMIRTARAVLSSLLVHHASSLDDELLQTLMIEVEAIINSRPLTEVDPDSEPLSPSQLLTLKTKAIMPPPGKFMREDLYCRKRWRRVQYLANEFWSRWTKEYLPTLQKRQKWTEPKTNLQPGDVVMMVDQTTIRSHWPKAIITEVHPGADGLVRKVTIKTSSATYDRPVHQVVLLYRPGIPIEEPKIST